MKSWSRLLFNWSCDVCEWPGVWLQHCFITSHAACTIYVILSARPNWTYCLYFIGMQVYLFWKTRKSTPGSPPSWFNVRYYSMTLQETSGYTCFQKIRIIKKISVECRRWNIEMEFRNPKTFKVPWFDAIITATVREYHKLRPRIQQLEDLAACSERV